jgi:hypothetical protein
VSDVLDDLARSAYEQGTAVSATRRTVLLFVITALSLLSLIPELVDFATSPHGSVEQTFRVVLSGALTVVASAALLATWWTTRTTGTTDRGPMRGAEQVGAALGWRTA